MGHDKLYRVGNKLLIFINVGLENKIPRKKPLYLALIQPGRPRWIILLYCKIHRD